jgi:2-polyprenyl-3-methyl-5-hydroxy-6-metoxy-1,4-benzoquinol methylase
MTTKAKQEHQQQQKTDLVIIVPEIIKHCWWQSNLVESLWKMIS